MKSALPLKVVVPLVLGIIASLAIAVYSELGYRRLESANRRMAVALEMQATLHETLALVADAETGERGYLLTGNEEYLTPYKTALPLIDGRFSKLRELLVTDGSPEQRDSFGRLNSLVGKKLGEMEAAIELYHRDGAATAQSLTNTGVGRRTMDEIRSGVDGMADSQRRQVDEASSRWAKDIEIARVGMQAVTALTVALFLVVWLLARRDADQREARRLGVQSDNRRLETLVEERTAALSELMNHLQAVREDEKTKLARDLHDELGGILIGVKMDVAWAERHMKSRDAEVSAKLERALQALDETVQIKRRIIENLRPTLLDNLGLSAAIDWQVRETCDRAGIKYKITAPEDDSSLRPGIAIALFRILQEALTNMVKYAKATHVNVDLTLAADSVTLRVEDDGVGIPDNAQTNLLSHGISGMRQRVRALHGEFSIGRRAEGGTVIKARIPVEASSAQAAEAPEAVAAPEVVAPEAPKRSAA